MAEIVTQAVEKQLYEAEVTVDGRHYAYRVSVPDDLIERVGADPAAIVRATIAFLLDRRSLRTRPVSVRGPSDRDARQSPGNALRWPCRQPGMPRRVGCPG